MTEEGPCIKYVLQKYELEQLTEYAQVDHSRLAMKSSMDRRDAISKLKTNLDRIMEETENILRNEKAVTSPHLFASRKASYSASGTKQEPVAGINERSTSKLEVINVLQHILQKQEELTVVEYTVNNSRFKVLVIEDTEL